MKSLRHLFLRKHRLALAAIMLLGSNLTDLPAFAIDDPKQEKRLEVLEEKFFSQTYKTDSDDARLGRVEDMLFNHARNGATEERLSSLEDALSTIKTSTKSAPARSGSLSSTASTKSGVPTGSAPPGVSDSSAGNNSHYRHFADMADDQDVDGDGFDSQASNFYNQNASGNSKNTSSANTGPKSGTLMTQQLSAMETQIFGKPNLKMPLTTRIKKLEQNVLTSNADTSGMSLPDRVKNLWTNLNTPGVTAGSTINNQAKEKAPQPMASEDSGSQPVVSRKTRQAKAPDDDVSDDQAMAEYLQKLKKGSSSSASSSSDVSTPARKASRNKSGWVDDSEMPKGQDPDYASTDDNPPIVIGGGSSGSSMQAQGFVQNFGSGMPVQQSNGPGLFSKLGQAIGGAVSGGNNNYGYGNGMYGGGMPYGYGGGINPYGMSPYGISPYGVSPYGGYGGLNPYGGGYGYTPPVMGPRPGLGGYGVNPYGLGGPRPGNPYGVNPYVGSPYGTAPYGAIGRRF